MQKLKEWQEKRNEIKQQEKKNQLKPFYVGSSNIVQPNWTVTTVSSRPVTRLQIKNATSKISTLQKQQNQTKQVQGNRMRFAKRYNIFFLGKVVTKKQKDVKKVESKPKAVSKPLPKQKNVLPVNQIPPKAVEPKPPTSMSSIEEAWIPLGNRTKQPVNKTVNFEETFSSGKPLSPFRFGTPSNGVSQSKGFNFNMKHKATSMFVNLSRGCLTSSKECAPPSPLCFHYKAANDLMNTPQQQDVGEEALPVEALASVKWNCFHDPNACDPVVSVVIASQPPKEATCHDTDSGNVGDDSSDSSDNEQDDKEQDGKGTGHCDSKDSAVEEEDDKGDVTVMNQDSSAVIVAGVSGATPRLQEVQRFKDLHADTVATLNKHCEVWEKKIDEMTSNATENNEDGMYFSQVIYDLLFWL